MTNPDEYTDVETEIEAEAIVESLLEAFALKDEIRTGWQLRGVERPESVAAHSWGVAYLVIALGEQFVSDLPDVDLDLALRLTVIHDLAEAKTGDVPTRAGTEASDEQQGDEPQGNEPADGPEDVDARDAIRDLTVPLPDRISARWEQYERKETTESRLVKELDLLDLCLQALYYERADRYDPDRGDPDAFRDFKALDEFFATALPRFRTPTGRAFADRIHERYRLARDTEE